MEDNVSQIARKEIINIVFAGIDSGLKRRPCHRRNRGKCSSQRRKVPLSAAWRGWAVCLRSMKRSASTGSIPSKPTITTRFTCALP